MTDPRLPSIAPDHARHDRLLVAALADRGTDALTPRERAQAEAQLAACRECAALHADLVMLTAAVPSAAIPTRPRDFTLTPADVERLRPRGLRRLIGLIGSSSDVFTRPLALGLTTLGIVGLLVASMPGVLSGFGSAGAAAVLSTFGNAEAPQPPVSAGAVAPSAAAAAPSAAAEPPSIAAAAPSAAASEAGLAAASAPSRAAPQAAGSYGPASELDAGASASGGDGSKAAYGADNGAPETNGNRQNAGGATEPAPGLSSLGEGAGSVSLLVLIAGTMLIVGLGLFAIRWSAHRLRER